MQAFQTIFEEYGADYAGAMGRFMNNEGLYVRLLGMLFQDDNLENLGAALEMNDLGTAFEAAHTLKGVVGNLGLTPLYQALEKLVEPLRAGKKREDYPALYGDVQTEFRRAEAFWEELKGVRQV
ncbi:Hpt domain-containing protein [Extibacter muris]|uniref:Hpt domain-containing protein n=1 Tax=Extibacter muris TaxID=1796622 RepID=UPI001D07DC5E|nr:Hpt domain-containing protein [Extibacter muris]MCB6200470.1 Hpt domain-containing protein [Extibacter muris]MCQ4663419.1 Hpt domain-containing protein [Extibacter muris]MCQ4692843.1 Hpt domain-containing protein [Extibacter muris]